MRGYGNAALAGVCLGALVVAVMQESAVRRRTALDQIAENEVAVEAASGAQFPPDQELITNGAPKKFQPFKFKPGGDEGKHWWWARQPQLHRTQALARASTKGAQEGSKGTECIALAKRARSSGLRPGDRELAKECLKLAKSDEKATRKHVDREIKAKVQRAQAPFSQKKAVPLTIHNKEVTLHLYRPHGFHEVC